MVRVEDIVHSPSVVHYVFNPDHYIGIVIANTTLLYKCTHGKFKDEKCFGDDIFFQNEFDDFLRKG